MENNKALILVDLENEWRDQESDYYVGDLSDLIFKTNKLIDFCRLKGYKIIFIRHVELDGDGSFAENTSNTELFQDLHRLSSDIVITKHSIGSFYKTNLQDELKNINSLVISGILTNLCVRSLVSDAYDREFQIKIIEDCCTAFDESIHKFTLDDLKSTREEVEIETLNDFITS